MGDFLSEKLGLINAQIILAVRNEMARTVEDCLSRRTRALLLDARESIRIAPKVAKLMAEEMGYNGEWQKKQVEMYNNLAQGYILNE